MTDETKTLVGKVKKVDPINSQNGKRYNLFMEGSDDQFNGWGEAPVQEGDMIEFEYVEKPKTMGTGCWKNITKIKDLKETHAKEGAPDFKMAYELMKQINVDLEGMEKLRLTMLMGPVVTYAARKNMEPDEMISLFNRLNKAIGEMASLHAQKIKEEQPCLQK